MNSFGIRGLETVTRTAPLGIGFRDSVDGSRVTEGLVVWAWPVDDPSRRVPGRINGAGVAVFARLPGVAADVPISAAAKRRFVVEVRDTLGRFLPVQLLADAPVRGLLGSPDGGVLVLLFSAPGRPVPSGLAVVRAELFDPVLGRPAANAIVELRTPPDSPDPFARGLSDGQGRVVVLAEWPVSKDGLNGTQPRLFDRTWPVGIVVRYAPAAGVGVPPPVPELGAAFQQVPGSVWKVFVPQPQPAPVRKEPFPPAVLTFGAPLTLKSTEGDSAGRLLVTAP